MRVFPASLLFPIRTITGDPLSGHAAGNQHGKHVCGSPLRGGRTSSLGDYGRVGLLFSVTLVILVADDDEQASQQ